MPTSCFSGFIAFAVCAGMVPVVKLFSRYLNLFDPPGPLKIHRRPISRLGGVAMAAGLFTSIAIFGEWNSWKYAVLLLALTGVWAVGLIDDINSLPSSLRFCVHLAAGAAFWLAGWRLTWFQQPFLDLAFTCLFVALVINAMNLLDGMDGLAAGTAAVVSLGFILVSAGGSKSIEMTMASSLLGVCLGVLLANAPPATIFMGDSGSTLIGVALAFLSLNWISMQPAKHNAVVPMIFLAVPVADVMLAILRRARANARLFDGDRRHFYDILRRRGWSGSRVFQFSILITGLFVFAGWSYAREILGAAPAMGIVVGFVAIAAYLLGSLRGESDGGPDIGDDRHSALHSTSPSQLDS